MKPISTKRAPATLDSSLQRVMAQVYDDINDIILSVNTAVSGATQKEVGKEGDLRLVKMGDESYRFEYRTSDGWIQSIHSIQIDKPSITAMTDNTGGTASNTIAASGGSWDNAEINNAIASLASKINELVNYEIGSKNVGFKIKGKSDF